MAGWWKGSFLLVCVRVCVSERVCVGCFTWFLIWITSTVSSGNSPFSTELRLPESPAWKRFLFVGNLWMSNQFEDTTRCFVTEVLPLGNAEGLFMISHMFEPADDLTFERWRWTTKMSFGWESYIVTDEGLCECERVMGLDLHRGGKSFTPFRWLKWELENKTNPSVITTWSLTVFSLLCPAFVVLVGLYLMCSGAVRDAGV